MDRDLLKNYLVETNGAKETAKLIARVQTNLGEPTRKEPHKIVWIQEGEYQVTSILEIYDKNSKAKFTSYAD